MTEGPGQMKVLLVEFQRAKSFEIKTNELKVFDKYYEFLDIEEAEMMCNIDTNSDRKDIKLKEASSDGRAKPDDRV
ncbi:13622_t:CDS:2, partial [Racocetra fulgida]